MRLIRYPEVCDWKWNTPSVFLAGALTGEISDGRAQVIEALRNEEAVIFGPPLASPFAVLFTAPDVLKEYARWEFDNLNRATIFSMWLPQGPALVDCLYNLGRRAGSRLMVSTKNFCLGIESSSGSTDYMRLQISLLCPSFVIANTLDEHIANIRRAIRYYGGPIRTEVVQE